MKKKTVATTALCLTLALLATPALARPVTITTKMKPYGGDGAYLALYLTDAKGAYKGTLWGSGQKSKYWSHLSSWYRATGGRVDAVTGKAPERTERRNSRRSPVALPRRSIVARDDCR